MRTLDIPAHHTWLWSAEKLCKFCAMLLNISVLSFILCSLTPFFIFFFSPNTPSVFLLFSNFVFLFPLSTLPSAWWHLCQTLLLVSFFPLQNLEWQSSRGNVAGATVWMLVSLHYIVCAVAPVPDICFLIVVAKPVRLYDSAIKSNKWYHLFSRWRHTGREEKALVAALSSSSVVAVDGPWD